MTILSSLLKIVGYHSTNYGYTLLEILHWLFSKSSHNFLSLIQGPVMKLRVQPTFHVCSFYLEHLLCIWIRPSSTPLSQTIAFALDTLLILVWMSNLDILLLDWKLLEAQGWITLKNTCICAEWLVLMLLDLFLVNTSKKKKKSF